MNAATSRSLELAVNEADGNASGEVFLINTGYWGINIEQGKEYKLTFYLRPGTFAGEVAAVLETEDGRGADLATHRFGAVAPGNEWKKYTATLKATGSDPKGRFVLTFRGKGTLQVDWVSLFPPTWRDKPNGLRPDLAQYLADLKPAIVRYPGGCYVEGWSWESAPDWRTMVVPPEERPGTYSYWKYRSTDGFGYHEFLQFAEDIGAEPLYVTFAGMTVHPLANLPLGDLQGEIQRALDAIEYANGPVDSKWGAVRAKMGHPAPFNLKYIEIGNEHNTPLYGEYYVKFREAIKARYPEMTVIMTMYWSGLNRRAIQRAGNENIDMVDEHAYHNNAWPRQNFNYFDRYDRSVPWTVFVGEYASQEATGNWGGGMGDAVYLMMIERNGDIVKMATYAPLFVNVNDRTWNFNLIEYDSSRSFAHGSYYVQKAFNENRPDVNLAMSSEFSPAAEVPGAGRGGRRGARRGGDAAGGQGEGGRRRGRGQTALPWFFAHAGYDRDDQAVIVKAVNYNSVPVPVEIELAGAASVGSAGKHIVIRWDNLRQDNTLDEPRRIVPQEQPLAGVAQKFTVTLAPTSVNVLRIPARKN
jgi:alpha-L-arabinofuranosidase